MSLAMRSAKEKISAQREDNQAMDNLQDGSSTMIPPKYQARKANFHLILPSKAAKFMSSRK